jgi:hypothetical protein
MDRIITVRITSNFGNEAIYPVCKDARIFAEMLGRKTLTRRDIASIKALGYVVAVQPTQVAL